MTPDFPYFIPLIFSQSGFSHSIIGMFIYCLPLGLASLGIFHFLIKYPALSLLPLNHQHRLYNVASNFSFLPLHRFLLIVLSILLGAFTHILWDSFTHPQGWMVKQFIILKSPVFTIGSHLIQIHEILQHGSTLIGGILLFYWYIDWYKHAEPVAVPINLIITVPAKIIIFVVMVFMALMIAIISALVSVPMLQTPLIQFYLCIQKIFIIGGTSFTSELVVFSFFWHFNFKKKNAM